MNGSDSDIMHLDMDKRSCTGCSACSNICPVQCITMRADAEGFLYPDIDYGKCINCYACDKHCHILYSISNNASSEPDIYASWSLDEDNRFRSTSGGLFTEIAKFIIDCGGCVVGAQYNEKQEITHAIVDNYNDLTCLRQSKYVQSNKGTVYARIKEILAEDRIVLFCGTPCECAGIKSFLENKIEKLILIDFVCLGVNSPLVYEKYKQYLERKYNSRIKKVWFRNKEKSWNHPSTVIFFENGVKYNADNSTDLYIRGFMQTLFLRPSCYDCLYKGFPRIADISLGDFWGISDYKKELDSNRGTSLVMINTPKGEELMKSIKNKVFSEKVPIEVALKRNNAIMKSATCNRKRNGFFSELNRLPFKKLIYKYCGSTNTMKFKRGIRIFLSKIKHTVMRNK